MAEDESMLDNSDPQTQDEEMNDFLQDGEEESEAEEEESFTEEDMEDVRAIQRGDRDILDAVLKRIGMAETLNGEKRRPMTRERLFAMIKINAQRSISKNPWNVYVQKGSALDKTKYITFCGIPMYVLRVEYARKSDSKLLSKLPRSTPLLQPGTKYFGVDFPTDLESRHLVIVEEPPGTSSSDFADFNWQELRKQAVLSWCLYEHTYVEPSSMYIEVQQLSEHVTEVYEKEFELTGYWERKSKSRGLLNFLVNLTKSDKRVDTFITKIPWKDIAVFDAIIELNMLLYGGTPKLMPDHSWRYPERTYHEDDMFITKNDEFVDDEDFKNAYDIVTFGSLATYDIELIYNMLAFPGQFSSDIMTFCPLRLSPGLDTRVDCLKQWQLELTLRWAQINFGNDPDTVDGFQWNMDAHLAYSSNYWMIECDTTKDVSIMTEALAFIIRDSMHYTYLGVSDSVLDYQMTWEAKQAEIAKIDELNEKLDGLYALFANVACMQNTGNEKSFLQIDGFLEKFIPLGEKILHGFELSSEEPLSIRDAVVIAEGILDKSGTLVTFRRETVDDETGEVTIWEDIQPLGVDINQLDIEVVDELLDLWNVWKTQMTGSFVNSDLKDLFNRVGVVNFMAIAMRMIHWYLFTANLIDNVRATPDSMDMVTKYKRILFKRP